MLHKFTAFYKGTYDPSIETVPFSQFKAVMDEFSLLTSLVFMQYDQYVRGEVIKKNDPKSIQLFEDYILEKLLLQGHGELRATSELSSSQLKPLTAKPDLASVKQDP